MKPHEVLGVPEDADEKTVNSAYRKAVRKAHPDLGGSPEEFRRITDARDEILGRNPQIEEDVIDGEAWSIIFMTFDQLVSESDAAGDEEVLRIDVAAKIRAALNAYRDNALNTKALSQDRIKFLTKLRDKWKAPDGQPNRMVQSIDFRISGRRATIETAIRRLKIVARAEELFAGYRFDRDLNPSEEAEAEIARYYGRPNPYAPSNILNHLARMAGAPRT